MSDGLPNEIWSVVFRPLPAWPWRIEPDYDPGVARPTLSELEFPRAVRDAFAYLKGLGFELTPPDAWELTADLAIVAWERADAVMFAALDKDGGFYVVAAPRADDPAATPVRRRFSALIGSRGSVATFGTFPVLATTPLGVLKTVTTYADAFRSRSAEILADRPLELEKLAASLEETTEELRRPRLVAHLLTRAERAWTDKRYDGFLEAAEDLEALGVSSIEPDRLAVARAHRRPPLTLGAEELDEGDRIRRAVDLVNQTHDDVHKAADERHQGGEALGRWEDAARAAHEALALLYSKEFLDNLERLRKGDAMAVDPALAFLEVDPWCFRSGYAKETILRFLPRVTLAPEQAERLRQVVLHAVDIGDRREFRGIVRLARVVANDATREELLTRLRSSDSGRARRALWVLDALGENFGPDDRARVLAILEAAATDPRWWRVTGWVTRIGRRQRDAGWATRLLDRATTDGPDAEAARRLLSIAGAKPSGPQKVLLGRHVLRAIEREGDSFERLAVLADTPGLRNDLVELYQRADDPDVRRRTWWAINAIRRHSGDDWPGDLLP